MGNPITVDDLLPADVILCRGEGLLSKVIVLMDGSRYSHSALHVRPEARHHFVGEAVGRGVVKDTIESLLADHTLASVRRILDATLDMSPVLTTADTYLAQGDRYAYEQLVLLAPLCLARKIPLPWPVNKLIRAILDRAADFLEQLFNAGKQPMICSEFVYRCYDEARPGPQSAYEIEIDSTRASATTRTAAGERPPRGRGIHPDSVLAAVLRAQRKMPLAEFTVLSPAETRPGDLEEAAEAYLDAVRAHKQSLPHADLVVDGALASSVHRFAISLARAQGRVPSAALENLRETAADFVTPGDLDRTQSLKDVGDLQPGD